MLLSLLMNDREEMVALDHVYRVHLMPRVRKGGPGYSLHLCTTNGELAYDVPLSWTEGRFWHEWSRALIPMQEGRSMHTHGAVCTLNLRDTR